jgi:hypothetical protein
VHRPDALKGVEVKARQSRCAGQCRDLGGAREPQAQIEDTGLFDKYGVECGLDKGGNLWPVLPDVPRDVRISRVGSLVDDVAYWLVAGQAKLLLTSF